MTRIEGDKYSGIIGDVDGLWFVRAYYDRVVRHIGELASVYVLPGFSTVARAEDVGVSESAGGNYYKIGPELSCGIDTGDYSSRERCACQIGTP